MKVTPFTLVLCALPLADATRATPRLRAPFILRGGAVLGPLLLATPAVAGTTAASLINCVGGASSFFGNIRVPAALLAGASLGQMFAATDESRGKWVPSLFSVLTALTAMLEIGVVFTSTATATALLGGGFNPMAVDPISFLVRELCGKQPPRGFGQFALQHAPAAPDHAQGDLPPRPASASWLYWPCVPRIGSRV